MLLLERHHAKGKWLYVCAVDLQKAIDRVSRKVMYWVKRKRIYNSSLSVKDYIECEINFAFQLCLSLVKPL